MSQSNRGTPPSSPTKSPPAEPAPKTHHEDPASCGTVAKRTASSTALVSQQNRSSNSDGSSSGWQLFDRRSDGSIVLTPTQRRIVRGATKAGISIADGLLLSSNQILNPVVSAAFVVYESALAVNDYRTGALNSLGYRTSLGDVALRIGKEVTLTAMGVGIGTAVGALIGISAIPVIGQFVLSTVLSVALGVCVGTLLTRYVDRLMARLQLRNQYGYPADEKGARRRFEKLLEQRHDLSTLQTCKIVQHYADYRVASGWESINDIADYRASGDVTLMPVSLQHFAVVQLQRKWGFVKERSMCKKVFKALMLQHHPDRGGSTELAAQLNKDFELYAFCQGWDSDCASLLRNAARQRGESEDAPTRPRSNRVVDFIRSLFRPATNSLAGANDLHELGLLLTLEAGSPAELHEQDEARIPASSTFESAGDDDDEEDVAELEATQVAPAVRQRSVARVLAALHQCYQATAEAITFSGLFRASEKTEQWDKLHGDVFVFNRMQGFLSTRPTEAEEDTGNAPCHCRGFTWRTTEEAVERREEAQASIIAAVFTKETSERLEAARGLWETAKSVAESYFRLSQQSEGVRGDDGAGQALDTLLKVQRQLESMAEEARAPWQARVEEWANRTVPGYSSLMEDIKAVGETASCALAGAHAKSVFAKVALQCDTYFHAWERKQNTLRNLSAEVHSAQQERATLRAAAAEDKEGGEAAKTSRRESEAAIQARLDDFYTQIQFIHKQFAEVDACVAELVEVCTLHLPEERALLHHLPSTCIRCRGGSPPEAPPLAPARRWAVYERERTPMNYVDVQEEPPNFIDPFVLMKPAPLESSPAGDGGEAAPAALPELGGAVDTTASIVNHLGIHFSIFQALYSDPLTGAVSPCWLKRYTLPDEAAAERQLHLAQSLLDAEFAVSERCASDQVLSGTDVFSIQESPRHLLFHYPRGATQQRFSSVNDVRRQISPLGLHWLHDALESVLLLHSCQMGHGRLTLSSFTYDDFGNTAVGFFYPFWDVPAEKSHATVEEGAEKEGDWKAHERQDTVDFGVMLLTEIVPTLGQKGRNERAVLAAQEAALQDCIRVYTEVGNRLIGKEEPRWSLAEARLFVRRCLQMNIMLERKMIFSKRVTIPPFWGLRRPSMSVRVVPAAHVHFNDGHGGAMSPSAVFLNQNTSLWATYWRCRRKMAQFCNGSSYVLPATFRQWQPLLFCNDEYEVNERFVFYPCPGGEEEAWERCQDGFLCGGAGGDAAVALTPKDDVAHFFPQFAEHANGGAWGIVCRVALGSVVVETPAEYAVSNSHADVDITQYNKASYAAKRRSHLLASPSSPPQIALPSPWARCYPEYIVRFS